MKIAGICLEKVLGSPRITPHPRTVATLQTAFVTSVMLHWQELAAYKASGGGGGKKGGGKAAAAAKKPAAKKAAAPPEDESEEEESEEEEEDEDSD